MYQFGLESRVSLFAQTHLETCFCDILLRELPEYDQELICDVIQRNAYFCHPENLVLSMLADNDVQIRQKAVNTMLDIRTNSSSFGQIEIPSFNLPSISFTAETYVDMIDWETSLFTEPPFTKYLSNYYCANSYRNSRISMPYTSC